MTPRDEVSRDQLCLLFPLMTRLLGKTREELLPMLLSEPNCFVSFYADDESLTPHQLVYRSKDSLVLVISEERVTVADIRAKRLLRVSDEDGNGVEHNQVLDLSNGERWEGDVLRQQPFGWGVLYDPSGKRVYEGFRVGGVSMCYGTQYDPSGVVVYEGEWCDGKRWGKGVQYDPSGKVEYEGEWMSDERAETRVEISNENESTALLHNRIEKLIVGNRCFNERWRVLDLSLMPNLCKLKVGSWCFKYVEEVKIAGLKKLKKVVIGNKCCTERMDGQGVCAFHLVDCPLVEELILGCGSFHEYSVFNIKNVPSLKNIEIGNLEDECDNFDDASLELRGDCCRRRIMHRPAKTRNRDHWVGLFLQLFSRRAGE